MADFPKGTHCQAFMITHFNLVSAAFGKCCLLGLNFTAYSHSKIISSENKDYDGIVVKSIHATIIFARKKNLLYLSSNFFFLRSKIWDIKLSNENPKSFIHVYVNCLPVNSL